MEKLPRQVPLLAGCSGRSLTPWAYVSLAFSTAPMKDTRHLPRRFRSATLPRTWFPTGLRLIFTPSPTSRTWKSPDTTKTFSRDRRPCFTRVVGRTSATPASYYYARRDGANWSPWQKISADINASNTSVMIAVFHSRLFVIWPVITTMADTPSTTGNVPKPGDPAPPPPTSHPEFQIGWSVLKNGVWSAKQISDTVLPSDWPSFFPTASRTDAIIFRAGVIPAPDEGNEQQLP